MRFPRSREDLTALGYLAGWKVVGRLPERPVLWAAKKAADRFSDHGRGPAQLRRNLARVTGLPPEEVPDALVKASMRSYLRYWVEAFRLPAIAGPELAQRIGGMIRGRDLLEESAAAGDGIILLVTHSGNWDMAGMWAARRFGGFTTVAERLRPEELYDAFVEFRESLGFEILPLTGGEPPMAGLRAKLESGGVIALVGERDFGGRGAEVDFFGEKTVMPIGAAQLARDTGAALHVAGLWFDGDEWGLKVHRRIPTEGRKIADIVQDSAALMASDIAAHPADWHMLQPLWTADKEERRRRKAREATGDEAGES
ncbi:phosphatidylinositol mannoside acyltransferase [Corynebacterium xerosis]|uniref:Phosphatidylinositol mannoside acyltransferase n=1 Tax=Corynebacterium xerosis TaxID=1725 RepID=A0A2N6T1P9_9CORY|nr:phosphatidylinositol mannoside acyltransferase [Corynebacterium xerosis]PMC63242.1 phosphatidylinositol mannoside acyltransferase [Corynebacterium xerosis]QGS35499.1 phosphatidylinositol mannoside acyltransferase [Corynebacterium xerosis]